MSNDIELTGTIEIPEQVKLEHEHEVKVEHDIDGMTLFIVGLLLWAPFWWYDTEIRCALGSEKACVSLKAPQPAPANP